MHLFQTDFTEIMLPGYDHFFAIVQNRLKAAGKRGQDIIYFPGIQDHGLAAPEQHGAHTQSFKFVELLLAGKHLFLAVEKSASVHHFKIIDVTKFQPTQFPVCYAVDGVICPAVMLWISSTQGSLGAWQRSKTSSARSGEICSTVTFMSSLLSL